MNLPTIPSNFSSGEVLSADRLNQILDWMRRVNELLPGLEISGGPGMRVSKSSAGTVISVDGGGNGAEFVPPHPFHVRVLYNKAADGGMPTVSGIAVCGGMVCISNYTPPPETLEWNGVSSTCYTQSVYVKGQIIKEDPTGKYLFLRYRTEKDPQHTADVIPEVDFFLTDDEFYDCRDMILYPYLGGGDFLAVRIAKFTAKESGLILVDQYLRSDVFLTNGFVALEPQG